MRAELNEKGCLIVTAESAIESFALGVWIDEFQKEAEFAVTLLIRTVAEQKEE